MVRKSLLVEQVSSIFTSVEYHTRFASRAHTYAKHFTTMATNGKTQDMSEALDHLSRAVLDLTQRLGAEILNCHNEESYSNISRNTFSRFIIPHGRWACGLWRPGEDVHLVFLTNDSQKRWIEVVVEALILEVNKSDMGGLTNAVDLDLSSEVLDREINGSVSKYWYLKHYSPAKSRIVLHYAGLQGISRTVADITHWLRSSTPLPSHVWGGPEKNLEMVRTMQRIKNGTESASQFESYVFVGISASEQEVPLLFRSRPATASPSSSGQAQRKFRDAHSAISRLRHDASHAGIEYDVGYLDRFEGMKWVSLTQWGGKSTEEDDFIPEHRVKMVRRVADSEIVWDREKRIDLTDG